MGKRWTRTATAVGLLVLPLVLTTTPAVAGAAGPLQVAAVTATGGPVILGGDDLTDHGGWDAASQTNTDGWFYIQTALANISAKVRRPNDGSIVALGSADVGFNPSSSYASNGGAAIAAAAHKNNRAVSFYNGETAINSFFDALRNGTVRPAVIWIPGNQTGNDLNDGPGNEAAALAANAANIGDFVNTGGGLLSHGVEYGWLGGLLPGVTMGCGGGSYGDLALTPTGSSAFPGVTNGQVNAGPWHGCFEGDIGDLQSLVESTTLQDTGSRPGRVVIGGAGVVLPGTIDMTPVTATHPIGSTQSVTATVRDDAGDPQAAVRVTFLVYSGPNSGVTYAGNTAADGTVTFTYTDNGGAGTDAIRASYLASDGTRSSTTAQKTWAATQQAPGAPENVFGTVDSAGRTATVYWQPPSSSGTSAISGYRVSRDGTGQAGGGAYSTVVAPGARSFLFRFLVPGNTYNLRVEAINAVGTGPASSVRVTIADVPSVPTSVSASVDQVNQTATLRWQPPASTGGSPITGYRVARDGTGNAGGGEYSSVKSATTRSVTFTRLVPGDTYTLTVEAINAVGVGPAATVRVTVGAPAGAPRIGTALAGSPGGSITATAQWQPPLNTGGLPITGYTVTGVRLSTTGQVLQRVTGPRLSGASRSYVMTLPAAGRWAFTVVAYNAAGPSVPSNRSNVVTGQ